MSTGIIIRYAHKSHINNLFVVSNGRSFHLGGLVQATFRTAIKGLERVVMHNGFITLAKDFETAEEVYAYIAKEFPGHTPAKVVVDRIVRTRWVKETKALTA